jgi:hypothetical protein
MRRTNTRDRGRPDPPEVLVVEQLGPRQSLTPEGFLLCEEVPIARIGQMVYGPGEVPVDVGTNGVAWVSRTPEELFKDECIASVNGKAVVDEHPDDDVNPDNWSKLARGHAFNARRGSGEYADCLVADLLITEKKLIESVRAGKREVSCGYEADYKDEGDGKGVQSNIIMNHVALVERGRCGPRCSIGDQAPTTLKDRTMTKKRIPLAEKIRKAFQDAGESLAEEMAQGSGSADVDDDEGSGHTHIHIHGAGDVPGKTETQDEPDAGGAGGGGEGGGSNLESRVAGLEASVSEILTILKGGGKKEGEEEGATGDEAPPFAKKDDEEEEDDEAKKGKTADSAALATSYQQVVSDAEILVPGFRFPTFDAKQPRKTTIDSMCQMRRKVLDHAYATAEGKALLDPLHDGGDLAKLDCSNVAMLFKAAAGAKKLLNNSASTKDAKQVANVLSTTNPGSATASIADLNKRNRDYWAKQSGTVR